MREIRKVWGSPPGIKKIGPGPPPTCPDGTRSRSAIGGDDGFALLVVSVQRRASPSTAVRCMATLPPGETIRVFHFGAAQVDALGQAPEWRAACVQPSTAKPRTHPER